MTGDNGDFVRRLRLTLPGRWFADSAPVLIGLLSGFASVWVDLYTLIQYVIMQSRLKTVSDAFLDLAARDYLVNGLLRRENEEDNSFRGRLLEAMFRPRATKAGVVAAAKAAGYSVKIFEPAQPSDTGAYSTPTGLAWNTVGAWGSMQMPFESLVVASPGKTAFESELWRNTAQAAPAAGVVWLRVLPS